MTFFMTIMNLIRNVANHPYISIAVTAIIALVAFGIIGIWSTINIVVLFGGVWFLRTGYIIGQQSEAYDCWMYLFIGAVLAIIAIISQLIKGIWF